MRIHPAVQGSEEWRQARLGIFTASDFDRLITRKTMKPSAQIDGLVAEKVAEWIIGCPLEDYSGGMVERGNALEEEAVARYALEADAEPLKVGLCLHDTLPVGASPDRLVGKDGLLEAKCPGPKAMVEYLLDPASLVEEYRCQVQGQLWVTGRAWCDLYAHNEFFPAARVRCERDEGFIAALSAAAVEGCRRLEAAKARLVELGATPPEPPEDAAEPEPDTAEPARPQVPARLPEPYSCETHSDQSCATECPGRNPF